MNADSKSSVSVSAGPVVTVPPPPAKSKSELTYVQEQAANAKAAFKQTLHEMVNDLGEAASLKTWMHAHPWVMMSSAAAAGFVAGCAAIPSKDQSFKEKFEQLKASVHRVKSDNHDDGGSDKGRAPKKGFFAWVVGDFLKAAIPAIGAIITETVKNPPPPQSAEQWQQNQAGNFPGESSGAS